MDNERNRKYYVEIWHNDMDFEKSYALRSKWFDTINEAIEWIDTIDYLDINFTKSLMTAIFDENGECGNIEYMGYIDDDEEDEKSTELNTLEDILVLLNGEPFRKIGGNLWCNNYNKLISIVYAVGNLTETNVEKIVAKLDEIDSNGEIY